MAENVRLQLGEGIVGTAVAEQRPLLVPDVQTEPRYKKLVPGMRTALVMPLVYRTRVIGALNILSRHANAFDETDMAMLGQFAAYVAVALENARLFEHERHTSEHLRDAGRDRPRARRRSSTSTSCSRASRSWSSGSSTTRRSASCSSTTSQRLE